MHDNDIQLLVRVEVPARDRHQLEPAVLRLVGGYPGVIFEMRDDVRAKQHG
jgi:hypothetical protein